jgi:hypothetical protein
MTSFIILSFGPLIYLILGFDDVHLSLMAFFGGAVKTNSFLKWSGCYRGKRLVLHDQNLLQIPCVIYRTNANELYPRQVSGPIGDYISWSRTGPSWLSEAVNFRFSLDVWFGWVTPASSVHVIP